MDEQLRELFKKAFNEGAMYEATLSKAYSFDSFLEDNIEQLRLYGVSNHALWRIEPHFDGISTAITTYKVVDQNGTLQYMGDRSQCEYFLQHGC